MYNSINYSDDIGGCESTKDRAMAAFNDLATLLEDLGLRESKLKAHAPSTYMPYLGVDFDTKNMIMKVPAGKVEEIRNMLELWVRKTKTTKKNLQQLLGHLFWISRCINFSRVLMSRLLSQLKSMHSVVDHKKVPLSEDCRLDIKWWSRYLRRFNGT